MSDFGKKIRLKEKAEEDMYFARRDRERIKALHEEDSRGSENTHSSERGDLCLDEENISVEPINPRGRFTSAITRWLRKITSRY